jgi:uncharacterized protein
MDIKRILDSVSSLDDYTNSQSKKPPIHLWEPTELRDSEMHIDTDGLWYHQGDRIERIALSRLFASLLRKEDDDYFLITPQEKFSIQVEDVPFILQTVSEIKENGVTSLVFTDELNEHVMLQSDHELQLRNYNGVEVPYLCMRDDLFARVSRQCFYHLVELSIAKMTQGRTEYFVSSDDQLFLIGVNSQS